MADPVKPRAEAGHRAVEAPAKRTVRRRRLGWKSLVIGVIIWCTIWGKVDPLTVLGGVLVSLLVSVVFPLPTVRFKGKIRPIGVLRLTLLTLRDLFIASIAVGRLALNRHREVRSAIVSVPLRTSSDLLVAMIVELVGLVPGSVVVQMDRQTATIHVHVLDVESEKELPAAHASVHEVEWRVIKAFGSDEELASLALGPRKSVHDERP